MLRLGHLWCVKGPIIATNQFDVGLLTRHSGTYMCMCSSMCKGYPVLGLLPVHICTNTAVYRLVCTGFLTFELVAFCGRD